MDFHGQNWKIIINLVKTIIKINYIIENKIIINLSKVYLLNKEDYLLVYLIKIKKLFGNNLNLEVYLSLFMMTIKQKLQLNGI